MELPQNLIESKQNIQWPKRNMTSIPFRQSSIIKSNRSVWYYIDFKLTYSNYLDDHTITDVLN